METEKLIGTGQEYKEGSSATNKAGSWKGTGRRTIGQEKKLTLVSKGRRDHVNYLYHVKNNDSRGKNDALE